MIRGQKRVSDRMLEPTASPLDFKELFLQEDELLAEDPGNGGDKSDLTNRLKTETPGPAGEPWISYTPIDRVGLAFSGGGIRSATFNLGVLKADIIS